MAYFSIPRSGLVLEYLGDGNALDTNDGTKSTLTATNVPFADCPVGYQKQWGVFNGSSSRVAIPDSSALHLTGSFSFVTSFRLSSFPGTGLQFRMYDDVSSSPYGPYWSLRDTSGVLDLVMVYNSALSSSGGLTLALNTPYLGIFVHDDATDTDTIWFQGGKVATLTGKTINAGAPTGTKYIGCELASGKWFPGNLTVRAYNRALTDDECLNFWHEFNRKFGGGSDFGAYIPAPSFYVDFLDEKDVSGQVSVTNSNVSFGATDQFGLARCGDFNGSSSKLSFSESNSYSKITIAFLYNADTFSGTKVPFMANNQNYFCQIEGTGRINFATQTSGYNYLQSSAGAASTGTWQVGTCTYDGATKKIYIDETEVASVGSISGSIPSGGTTKIGVYNDDSYGWWDGKMGAFLIFKDVALDANQVKFLVKLLKSRYPYAFRRSIPQAITAKSKLWIPGIVSGTTAYDLSGNGNNGTTSGSPVAIREYQNNGLTFNGSSQSVTVPNLSGIFGVSMWVYATAVSKTLFTYSAGKTISLDGSYGITSANLTSPVYYVNNGASQVGYGSKWMLVTVGHSTDSTSSGSWATSSLTGKASDLFFWNEAPTQEAIQKLYFATYRN